MAQTILCVDKDKQSFLSTHLQSAGYTVTSATTAAEALTASEFADLILLSPYLPDMSGLRLLQDIRSNPATTLTPVIIISDYAEEVDKLLAFELGADDYIMRPYAIRELLARIRNVLRRCGVSAHGKLLRIRNLTIDPDKMEARHNNHALSLTQKEYGILLFLAENVGKVVTREDIMEEVWGYEINGFSGGMRTVDTHVRHIRVKLGEDGEMIETVHGVGFKMRAEGGTANTSPAK